MTVFWAMLFKPLFMAVFMGFVGLIVWTLYKTFPDGRLKTFLFKVRGDKGSYESHREKLFTRILAVLLFIGLYGSIFWYISSSGF